MCFVYLSCVLILMYVMSGTLESVVAGRTCRSGGITLPEDFGRVCTNTSTDMDPHCRQMLASLHEAGMHVCVSNLLRGEFVSFVFLREPLVALRPTDHVTLVDIWKTV